MAHDGSRAPIQLVDEKGCVPQERQKIMSPFRKVKNFDATANVLSYAYFQVNSSILNEGHPDSTYYHRGRGVSGLFSKAKGEGVKNPENFAYVLNGWPLSGHGYERVQSP